jgi:hypothetical protein
MHVFDSLIRPTFNAGRTYVSLSPDRFGFSEAEFSRHLQSICRHAGVVEKLSITNDVFSTNRRTVAYLVIGREVNCLEPFRVRCSTGINLAKAIAGSAVLK